MSYDLHLQILQCPLTGEDLFRATPEHLQSVNSISADQYRFTEGLVNKANQYFFPVINDILYLLPSNAIDLYGNKEPDKKISFDRQRIFNYFRDVGYYEYKGLDVYEDAKQFVDFRPFLQSYNSKGFASLGKYLPSTGKYFIDVASGPVAFREYIQLSEGYECRVCIDISANALMHAKANLDKAQQKSLLICGDMLHLPLKADIADAVICQHALFHVPGDQQCIALKQLVRIVRPDRFLGIVYDWFYHAWFMNIMLGPVQVYRIVRHILGKWYARMFRKNKLYFFAHSPRWFRKNNPGKQINFYCWRSVNIYFSRIYFHNNRFGKWMLRKIIDLEKKYSELMGRLGEYGIVLIKK